MGKFWAWVDGMNVNDRTTYICDTFSFVDDTSTGYTQIAFNFPSPDAGISALGYDANNDWILLPSEASGVGTKAIGDWVECGSGWRVPRLGDFWYGGGRVGAFHWACDCYSSTKAGEFGARLMYIPQTV